MVFGFHGKTLNRLLVAANEDDRIDESADRHLTLRVVQRHVLSDVHVAEDLTLQDLEAVEAVREDAQALPLALVERVLEPKPSRSPRRSARTVFPLER